MNSQTTIITTESFEKHLEKILGKGKVKILFEEKQTTIDLIFPKGKFNLLTRTSETEKSPSINQETIIYDIIEFSLEGLRKSINEGTLKLTKDGSTV